MEGTAGAAAPQTNPGVAAKKGDASPVNLNVNDFNQPNPGAAGGDGGAGAGGDSGAGAGGESGAAGAAGASGAAGGDGGAGAGAGAAGGDGGGEKKVTAEEALKALSELGINVEGGIEKLKERMSAAPELTDEQKKKAAEEKDVKLLQLYMANGGTAEQFVAMKNLLAANPEEISAAQIKKELKDAGFDDEEVAAMMSERYYQSDPEKLTKGDEESEEDFKKRKDALAKKNAFGKNKIASRGQSVINQAKTFFTGLEEAMSIQESLSKKEAEFLSKVDEVASKIERKIQVQLGKVNDQDLSPIEYEITEQDVAEVVGVLKDKDKRNQFFNKDNGLNLEVIMPIMLRNRYLESLVKVGYISGGDAQVAEYNKVFGGRSAHDIGVGGAGNNSGSSNGKVAKAGKAQPMPVTLK